MAEAGMLVSNKSKEDSTTMSSCAPMFHPPPGDDRVTNLKCSLSELQAKHENVLAKRAAMEHSAGDLQGSLANGV